MGDNEMAPGAVAAPPTILLREETLTIFGSNTNEFALFSCGFSVGTSTRRHYQHTSVPTVATFAAVNGNDAVVPIDFVVPRAAPWPKRTWSLTLGISVANKRARTRAYASVLRVDREQLQALGVWELLGLAAPDDWNE